MSIKTSIQIKKKLRRVKMEKIKKKTKTKKNITEKVWIKRLKRRLKKGECPILFIRWWDATTHPTSSPWVTLREAIEGYGPYYCESTGFVVKLTKDGLTIVQSLSKSNDGESYDITNAFTIPVGCIIGADILG